MRLIDADYLVNKMIPNCPIEEGGIPLGDFDKHQEILKLYPTIEAEPVVHGRWAEDLEDIICSECGCSWNLIDNCTETFNYCPNCGAKMDGGEKDV